MTAPLCERIDDFVDGRLDAAGREEMQLHLATCEACQAVLFDSAMLEAIVGKLRGAASGCRRARRPPPSC